MSTIAAARRHAVSTVGVYRWVVAALVLLSGCSLRQAQPSLPDPEIPSTGSTPSSPPSLSDPNTSTSEHTDSHDVGLVGNLDIVIINTVPHDPEAYTQGLEWSDGALWESTGRYGSSSLRRLDPSTGEVLEVTQLDPAFFGEGLTVVDNEIWQLTWQEGVLLRYEQADRAPLDPFVYQGEGWGLCRRDAHTVIRSDGSANLWMHDTLSFAETGQLQVRDGTQAVTGLNELECVGNQVLANIYGRDEIVVINAQTGVVEATVNAASLRPPNAPVEDWDYVLNGIAYRPETRTWFLTGKYWDVLYEVELRPAPISTGQD